MRAAGQTPVTASMPALSQGLPVSGGPSFLPVGTAAFPTHPGTDVPPENVPPYAREAPSAMPCHALSP